MLKLKEIDCLENRIELVDDIPFHIYISLVEKYRNGQKIDGWGIVLAHDAGYPTDKNLPTLIGGNIDFLAKTIKDGKIPFDVYEYDGTDFPNSYLNKLIPVKQIKEKYKYPKDFLNWEYDVEAFNFFKCEMVEDNSSKKILCPIAPVPLRIKLKLPAPKPVIEKPAEIKLIVPSNMGIIAYD